MKTRGHVVGILALVVLGLGFVTGLAAQPQAQSAGQQSASQASLPQGSPSPAQKPGVSGPQESEKKITPQEAQELFRSVDEILKFVSKDTTLPVREEVRRNLVNRDEVVAFIRKHMEEGEDSQRLRRSELVLKKFGLLPRTFDLQTFLVALLREQVAGYYDPKTKSVNLLDWIEPEQQKPVLAHELTHALQDQSFELEKYMKAGAGDLGASKKEPSVQDIDTDEASTAHQAVVEGQAMVVLIDYMLAPTGQSVTDSPQIVEALKAGMLVGTADSVEFRNAPLYIKEALTFPYRYGLDFEAELLTRVGKENAYAGVFKNPPRSTREIMEPTVYLSKEKLPPMPMADFKKDFKNYDKFDVGAVGEFDVAILMDQYAGTEVSKRLYPHWTGGYYYAVRPKGDTLAPLGVMYLSRWSTPQKASEFAYVYAKGLKDRYQRAHEVGNDVKGSKPQNYTVETLTGTHSWLTEEGPLVIEVKDDLVLVNESLDEDTTEELRRDLLGAGK
ncbi:MAG TPA: hypothetical protein VK473_10835 [Terriglobales bacterium]|nr:hypothetical protein [Terriglobales bacterium]